MGIAVLFEKQMEKKLLYLPCRHHIYDLVVRNVAKVFFGNTVGPSTPFFEKFKKDWNSIKEKPTNKLKIEDEWLKNIERNVVVEIKQMLDDNFKRSDYKEVVELSLFFIGRRLPY